MFGVSKTFKTLLIYCLCVVNLEAAVTSQSSQSARNRQFSTAATAASKRRAQNVANLQSQINADNSMSEVVRASWAASSNLPAPTSAPTAKSNKPAQPAKVTKPVNAKPAAKAGKQVVTIDPAVQKMWQHNTGILQRHVQAAHQQFQNKVTNWANQPV